MTISAVNNWPSKMSTITPFTAGYRVKLWKGLGSIKSPPSRTRMVMVPLERVALIAEVTLAATLPPLTGLITGPDNKGDLRKAKMPLPKAELVEFITALDTVGVPGKLVRGVVVAEAVPVRLYA